MKHIICDGVKVYDYDPKPVSKGKKNIFTLQMKVATWWKAEKVRQAYKAGAITKEERDTLLKRLR